MLHPGKRTRKAFVTQALKGAEGPVVAASDYMKALPDLVRPWIPNPMHVLGTDGFGRSESREALRRHFEVDAESIAVAALYALSKQGKLKPEAVDKAIKDLGIDPEKADPVSAGPVTSYRK